MYQDITIDKLITCDPILGLPNIPFTDFTPDLSDLKSEMSRLNITSALVRHRKCMEAGAYVGNDILMEEIADCNNLLPVWSITPDGREPEFDIEILIKDMLNKGVRIAWADPVTECFLFQSWSCKKMFEVLSECRIPIMLNYGAVSEFDLHQVMQDFPKLRIILMQIPRLGRNRKLEPLIQLHKELYLCFSPSFSVHEYWPDLCKRFGDHRWVWGSGYPTTEGGTGITGLMYSGLNKNQIEAVAYKNIERLIAEVKL